MGLPFQNSKCFWLGFKTWYFHSFHLCFKWITFEGIIFHVAERACWKAIQQPHSGLLLFSVAPVTSGPSLALDMLVAGNIHVLTVANSGSNSGGKRPFFMWISAFVCHAFAVPAAFTSEHKATFQRRLTNYPQLPEGVCFCVFCVPLLW